MNDETPIRVFLIAVSVIQAAISARYMTKAKVGSTIFRRREEGILLSLAIFTFYLAYAAAVVAYFLNPQWMNWSSVPIAVWFRWMGIVPLLSGAAILIWGLHHLGANLTISISLRKGHALITTGPYRWVRHPLYSGGMVESVGVCLLMANWFVLLASGLFWALIAIRAPLEERNLVRQFGDEYEDYMQTAGRFVPFVGRHRGETFKAK